MTDIIDVPIEMIVEQPSCFCTVYHLSNGCGVVRLTFGEKLNDEYRFRVAVSLPLSEARGLALAIQTLLTPAGPERH